MSHKDKIYKILILLFFVGLAVFRLHNAIKFNPYWGYDGGAHLEYIQAVLEHNRLPSWQENYLAWHEPGFYYLYAGLGRLVSFVFGQNDFLSFTVSGQGGPAFGWKFLQFISAGLSLMTVYLVYKISQHFTSQKKVQLASLVVAGLMSAMTETSNYLTNELLLAFLITLLFYYFITFSKKGWHAKRVIVFAVLCGAAALTKLSAFIFILSVLIWFIYRSFYTGRIKWLVYALLILIVVSLAYLPWAVYKHKNFGSWWSVNAYEDRLRGGKDKVDINSDGQFVARSLLQDNADHYAEMRGNRQINLSKKRKLPPGFFYNFNAQIFNNPFWMTGNNSFWTIIFADAFSDYFMISNNVDKNNLQVPDDQRLMTGAGNFVTHTKFRLSILLLVYSLFLVIIFIGGVLGLFWQLIKQKFKPSVNLLILIFIGGSFLALAFNVWQFPALERGTLKASFILSVWPLLAVVGLSWLDMILKKLKATFLWPPVWLVILVWGSLSVIINWI